MRCLMDNGIISHSVPVEFPIWNAAEDPNWIFFHSIFAI